MGELAALAGMAANVGGTAIEAIGARYEGQAAQASAKYNARAASMQAREQSEAVRSQARQIRGENITRVAKSGVRMEGSPLEVLANNAYRAEKQAQNIMRTGKALDTLYRMEGRQAIVASRFKIAQAVFRGVGSALGGSGGSFAFGGQGGPGAAGGGGAGAGSGGLAAGLGGLG